MTTCKIDHTAAESIPVALCRACNPGKFTPAPYVRAAASADAVAEHQERMERRERRKLRAERKRLMGEIDLIAGRNPPATAKLQAALDAVNRELFIIS